MDHIVIQWKCVYDTSKELGDFDAKLNASEDFSVLGGHEYKDSAIERTSDNYGKVQHWRSSICPPTKNIDEILLPPVVKADLEQVHGVRISDTHHSVRYNANGNLVFIIGSLGVIQSSALHQQLFYQQHRHPLVSISVTLDGLFAASGEVHEDPEIHIWDACNAYSISRFHGLHRKSITCLAFNQSGGSLVSLGQDPMNSIVILRSPSCKWEDAFVVCSMSTCFEKMLWVLYFDENPYPICVGGKGGLLFYRTGVAGAERKKGVFGKDKVMQPLVCGTQGLSDGHSTSIITGTVSGHLYEWRDEQIVRSVSAHDMTIASVANLGRWGYATGATDGMVKVWSTDLKQLYTINLLQFIPVPVDMSVYILQANLRHTKLAIGMKSGELYEFALLSRSNQVVNQGHGSLQLHSISACPTNPDEYATAGDDGSVIIWSIERKSCVRRVEIDAASRAMAWSNDGSKIVVGIGGNPGILAKDGAFMILDASTLQIIFEDRKSKRMITDAAWAGGEYAIIALSSADGKVYLHDSVTYDLKKVIAVPNIQTVIKRIDLSNDGQYLRMGTEAGLFVVVTSDGSVASDPKDTRDVNWLTFGSTYDWLTQGTLQSKTSLIA